MLGYQRAGVSIAMAALVKAGFIEKKRGKVIVSNRPVLEAAACECYGDMQNELDEFLLGPKKWHKCSNSHRTKSPSVASVTLIAGPLRTAALSLLVGVPASLAPGRGHCSKPNRAKTRMQLSKLTHSMKPTQPKGN